MFDVMVGWVLGLDCGVCVGLLSGCGVSGVVCVVVVKVVVFVVIFNVSFKKL